MGRIDVIKGQLIRPRFDHSVGDVHWRAVEENLRRILPHRFFEEGSCRSEILDTILPLFTWGEMGGVPLDLSFFILAPCRANAFKFFFEMISRWLVPGKRLDVRLFTAYDFSFEGLDDTVYTLAEIRLFVEEEGDLNVIKRNLPTIEAEVCLGIGSVYHANRILEIKGLLVSEKAGLIQDDIAEIVRRKPAFADDELYREMQHFLVMCQDHFKQVHTARQMSRMICIHYFFRKLLRQKVIAAPHRHHLALKLRRAHNRLCLYVGISLHDNEQFGEEHLLKGVSNYVHDVKAVPGSFYANRRRGDAVHTLYLEVEKEDGSRFSQQEVRRLNRELSHDLKGRIEQQLHSIFMPRNEEEVMRSIFALNRELKLVRDLPQVMITFHEQTAKELAFTVIVLRVLRDEAPSIPGLFQSLKGQCRLVPELQREVGTLRKKYPKEANVFRLMVEKSPFLRTNHSVDLYRARKRVALLLGEAIGDFRDYNGGMLSKQNELFAQLMERLGEVGRRNALLVEEFFYSLTPVVMRSVLEPEPLKRFFLCFLDSVEKREFQRVDHHLRLDEDSTYLYVMIASVESSYRKRVKKILEQMSKVTSRVTTVELKVIDAAILGILYRCDHQEGRRELIERVKGAIEK